MKQFSSSKRLITGLACVFLGACASTELYTTPDVQSYKSLTPASPSRLAVTGPMTGAEGLMLNAEGLISDAEGSIPNAEGSMLNAEGSTPIAEGSLRVMTLNMAHARGNGINQMLQNSDEARQNLLNIATLLARQSADVVSLQEVDYQSIWNGNFDHVRFLAERANLQYSVSGSHVNSMGLDYGTALVAKLDLGHPQSTIFTPSEISASKGFVVSSINWPGKACIEVDVVSTHLDFASEQTRREQAAEIIASLKQRNRPVILMGDFNTDWRRETTAVRILAEQLGLHAYKPDDSSMVTFPKHTRRLDWILVSAEISIDSYEVLQDVVSDHLGIVSDLSINRDCG